MSVLVVVAEAEEIEIIPRAYKECPVLVVGVGAKALDTLINLNPKVDLLVNVGYCGSSTLPVGTVVYSAECETVDDFLEGKMLKYYSGDSKVIDMEGKWIERWCKDNGVALKFIKVVSDNLCFKQYKEQLIKTEKVRKVKKYEVTK
jgi:nucleoside phosphorylase